jgi:hypothetical protein
MQIVDLLTIPVEKQLTASGYSLATVNSDTSQGDPAHEPN